MTDPSQLSRRERQIMDVVFSRGEATANDVLKGMDNPPTRTSVRTILRILEEKGYLFHPHTSAGRMPTDLAYRVYVDGLMKSSRLTEQEEDALRREFHNQRFAIEDILQKAAQVLGVLTQELGVAVAPSFDAAILERLELMPAADGRLLMVLLLRSGSAKTMCPLKPALCGQ